jgi:hypothetical protein
MELQADEIHCSERGQSYSAVQNCIKKVKSIYLPGIKGGAFPWVLIFKKEASMERPERKICFMKLL